MKSKFGFATTLTVVIGLLISLLAFTKARNVEEKNTLAKFERLMDNRFNALKRDIEIHLEVLYSLKGLYDASELVERNEFRAFTHQNLKRHNSIQALEWVPRVIHEERKEYESAAKNEGFSDFRITIKEEGKMVTSPTKNEYFPVYYVEPYSGNEAAFGFDLASNSTRMETLKDSQETGLPLATARITLVQEKEKQFGFLVFAPVYSRKKGGANNDLRGFVLGVFRVGNIVEEAIQRVSPDGEGINLWLYDITTKDSRDKQLLHFHQTRVKESTNYNFTYTRSIKVAGRIWQIVASPTLVFVSSGYTWQPYIFLFAGFFITAFLIAYIELQTGKVRTEQLRMLQDIINASNGSSDLHDTITICLRKICEHLNWEVAHAFFPNQSEKFLVSSKLWYMRNAERYSTFKKVSEQSKLEYGEGLPGQVWQDLKSSWTKNFQHESNCPRLRNCQGENIIIKAGFCFPLLVHGKLFAVLEFYSDKSFPVNNRLMESINYLSKELGRIIERKMGVEALKENEKRISAVVGIAVNGIIVIDRHGLITLFNPAAETIFGYYAGEVVGKNVSMLMPNPDSDQHDGYLEHHIRTGENKIIGIGREVVGLRSDGQTFPMTLAIGQETLGDNLMFVGCIEDITIRKNTEEALTIAKEKAEESNRLKSEFLNTMSHELRTPLTVILGNIPLLTNEADLPDSEEIADIAIDVEKSSNHLLTLINDLLDISKIEAGKMDLHKEVIVAQEAIQEAMETINVLAKNKNITLKSDFEQGVEIYADPIRLKQVLLNLFSNAVKFTKDGVISTSVKLNNQKVEIKIEDTGCGMDEEDMGCIFDIFRQVDGSKTRKAGGSGLGLAITKKLVELHGGEIRVSSIVDQGSCFTFSIPVMSTDQ